MMPKLERDLDVDQRVGSIHLKSRCEPKSADAGRSILWHYQAFRSALLRGASLL